MKRVIMYILILLALSGVANAELLSTTTIMAKTISNDIPTGVVSEGSHSGGGSHSSFISCGNTICGVNSYCSNSSCVPITSPDQNAVPANPSQLQAEVTPNEMMEKVCDICPAEKECDVCEVKQPLDYNYILLLIVGFICMFILSCYLWWKADYWYKAYEEAKGGKNE